MIDGLVLTKILVIEPQCVSIKDVRVPILFKFFSTNLSFLAKLWGPFSLLYSDWRFAPDLDSLHEVGFTFIALLSPIETCIKMHQFIMC